MSDTVPHLHCRGSQLAVMVRENVVLGNVEEIGDRVVDRNEALKLFISTTAVDSQLLHRLESGTAANLSPNGRILSPSKRTHPALNALPEG